MISFFPSVPFLEPFRLCRIFLVFPVSPTSLSPMGGADGLWPLPPALNPGPGPYFSHSLPPSGDDGMNDPRHFGRVGLWVSVIHLQIRKIWKRR